jgi:hypothetical protein
MGTTKSPLFDFVGGLSWGPQLKFHIYLDSQTQHSLKTWHVQLCLQMWTPVWALLRGQQLELVSENSACMIRVTRKPCNVRTKQFPY